MAEAFNPDKYLAEKNKVAQAPMRQSEPLVDATQSFNPDKYLTEKTKEPSWLDTQLPFNTSPRGFLQGALNTLPTIGTVAGGIGGGVAGSIVPIYGTAVGGVAGAGLGAMAGQNLKAMGEQALLGNEAPTRKEFYGGLLEAGKDGAMSEMGGQALTGAIQSKPGQYVLKKAGKAASKVASSLSGVSQKEVETYAKNVDEINALAKGADHDSQEMADQLRQKLNDTIVNHRKQLSDEISKALETGSKDKVDITRVIEKLEESRAALNPSLHPEAIANVDELIGRIKGTSKLKKNSVLGYVAPNEKAAVTMGNQTEVMDEVPKKFTQRLKHKVSVDTVPITENMRVKPGEATWPEFDSVIELPVGGKPRYFADAKTLNQITKFLQTQAEGAYGMSPAGFQIGTSAAQAAKGAAASGREILNEAVPAVAKSNNALARLHDIEDVMNKNILAEGKTASPLLAAGSGGNPANAKVLKQLGEETGTDMLGEAEKIAAARTFGKPSLLPVDATGKSLTRIGVAGGAGYLLGGPMGALAAEGVASPAMIKAAINTGNKAAPVALNPQMQGLLLREGLLKKKKKGQGAGLVNEPGLMHLTGDE